MNMARDKDVLFFCVSASDGDDGGGSVVRQPWKDIRGRTNSHSLHDALLPFEHTNRAANGENVRYTNIVVVNISIALLLYLNVNKNKNGIIPWVKLISSLNLLLHSLHIHRLLS